MKVRFCVEIFVLIGVVVLFIAGVLTASSYAKPDPETIVGMWLFDEGSGDVAEDSSGNGNDGQIFGAKWVNGKIGSALKFNGTSDYVDCGNDPILNPTTEITVVAWVKTEGEIISERSIVARGWPGEAINKVAYTLWHLNDSNVQKGRFGFAFGQWSPGWVVAASADPGTLAKAGQWYHVVGTFDGSKFNLYVNGNLIDESTDVQSLNENDVITTIGAYKEALIIKYHVDGIIDDVAIFNVALTQDDIESIMRTGLKSAFAVSPTGKLTTTWANIKQ